MIDETVSYAERGLALVLLLLFALPMILVAFGVKLSSPGPILFRARRVGRGGRLFTMLKFRSMRASAAATPITVKRDSRVYPFGAVIRLTKLDELPQLFNIICGDMRFIGPRPEDPTIVEVYYRGWMRRALQVPPGLTGIGSIYEYAISQPMAEANFLERYVERELPKKLAMEIAYARVRHPCKSLEIILCTAFVIVQKSLGLSPVLLPGLPRRVIGQFANFGHKCK